MIWSWSLIKMKKRLILILIIIAVLVVAAVSIVLTLTNGKNLDAQPTKSPDEVLTAEQAKEDLVFMYETVRDNHPCYLDGSGLDKVFDKAYEEAEEKLSACDIVTVRDLWEIGAEMYCSIEDGHTFINFYDSKRISENEILASGKIVRVDGVSREELLSRFRKVFPCEPQVDFYVDYMLDEALKLESWNQLLEIDTSDGVIVEVQTESGVEVLECTFGYKPSETVNEDTSVEGFYSYEFYEENLAAVFTLDKCVVTDGYKKALEEFFQQVNEKNIIRVAVDLRRNGGGNSQVINEFMKYIDVDSYYIFGGNAVRFNKLLIENKAAQYKNKKNGNVFSGELYALTSNYTFSSAMMFAVTVSDNKIGKVIGEIPGNMPASYGDVLKFQAPNSKLICSVSYKKFYRADRAKDDIPLIPDIETDEKDALEVFLNLK